MPGSSCCRSDRLNWIITIFAAIIGVALGYYLNSEPGLDIRADPHALYLIGPAPKEVKITVKNSHWFSNFDQQISLAAWEEGDIDKGILNGLEIDFDPHEASVLGDIFISNMTIRAKENHNKSYRIVYAVQSSSSIEKTGVITVRISQ